MFEKENEKPEVVDEKEDKVEVKDIPTAEVTEPVKPEKEEPQEVNTGGLVTVNLKEAKTFKCGGKWYDLKKGVNKVPKSVKEVLMVSGALKAM